MPPAYIPPESGKCATTVYVVEYSRRFSWAYFAPTKLTPSSVISAKTRSWILVRRRIIGPSPSRGPAG